MNAEELRRVGEFCQTPFYVFDERELAGQVSRIREVLPPHTNICFAMKANPFVVGPVSRLVDRLEACSTGEVRICQAAGVDPSQIVVSGVAKDPALMRELIAGDAGIGHFTCESRLQFDMLSGLAREAHTHVDLLLRLSNGSQFGMDAATIVSLAAECANDPHVTIRGIQYFTGTQKTSSKRIVREVAKLDRFVAEVGRAYGSPLAEMEYGAGLPVEYFERDPKVVRQTELEPALALSHALADASFDGQVAIELGRRIAATCGTYVTRVVDAKQIDGQNVAIVDGGMHQITYYGHAMAMKQPPCRALLPHGDASLRWTVCGSLCTTNDILVKQMPLGDLAVGDLVAFDKAGAYCMTEGMSLFLSRDLPSIVWRDRAGKLTLLRDRIETAPLNSVRPL